MLLYFQMENEINNFPLQLSFKLICKASWTTAIYFAEPLSEAS